MSSDPAAVDPTAATGFTRGADDYERARPSYPAELLARLRSEVGVSPDARVLDLAAGTGKLARLLVEQGVDVVAVEPLAEMRAKLTAALPDTECLEGTAEHIPLPDASVDAVTVAQAFHWFDVPVALAEIARVLRPAGGLALIWNVRDESVDWVRRFTELIIERSGGTPYRRDYTFSWWSEVVAAAGAYSPLQSARFDNPQPTDVDLVVDRAASTSFVSALPDDERQATLAELRAMLVQHPDIPASGSFLFPHETDLYWCHRRT